MNPWQVAALAEGPQVHRKITRMLSLAMCAVGVTLVVRTLAHGGGPLAVGFIVGLLFFAVGALRFWITFRDQ